MYNRVEHPAFKYIAMIKRQIKHGEKPGGFETPHAFFQFLLGNALGGQSAIALVEASIISCLFERASTHYFIETSALYDFLSDMKIKDESPFGMIASQSTIFSGFAQVVGGNNIFHSVGHIHYPSKTEAALSFQFTKTQKENVFSLSFMRSNDVMHYGKHFNLQNIYHSQLPPNPDYPDEKVIRDTQLIINMFLYAEAFPDSVVQGVPDGQPIQYDPARSFMFKTHHSLIDRSGPSPHFRRGHFRRLVSDHWTKKRGQVVFVHSTFVKGHAKTVEDIGDAREEMVAKEVQA